MASFYEGDADQGMDLGAPPASDPAPAAATGGGGQPPAQGRINIMGGGGEDSDSEEEDGQAFFAGGSTNSGTNVSQIIKEGLYHDFLLADSGSKEKEGKQCW